MNCFTSITFAYLSRARILASGIKRYHPDWHFIAVITDKPPAELNFNPLEEPFDEIIWAEDLGIPDFKSWIFGHDVVEACTAVKPFALKKILLRKKGDCVYLDPDIAVFSELSEVVQMLSDADVVLTPHQLRPNTARQAITDNEKGSLKYGIYNLGFIAVSARNSAMQFVDWWCDRLYTDCRDETAEGIFVDQKWCDLAPALFDNVFILRHPGYNVASWNIDQRTIHYHATGNLCADDKPLVFYHFTKYGPLGETMTRRYAGGQIPVYDLWRWYGEQLRKHDIGCESAKKWHYAYFKNGSAIEPQMRKLYRSREDLRKAFADPFLTDGDYHYYNWYQHGER